MLLLVYRQYIFMYKQDYDSCIFFFSSRRRHTRCSGVSWARRCVQETDQRRVHGEQEQQKEQPKEPKEEPQREDQGQDRFRRQQKQPKPKTGLFSGLKKQQ
eukprot:TRINITY_DN3170_c0_g1_i7.p3 TRINITY_DN3170_c0_g1~~TRINITY_DN3170_c0_g1_i7.p3  ORF type:complete len:101 (-),score=47.92 TRINITY_DN3170_c0_g1_i7:35-337(-)